MNNLPVDTQWRPTAEGVFDITDENYFKIKACSNSALRHFRQSPAHVKAYEDQPASAGATMAMKEGSAWHWAMLQPDKFKDSVIADLGINKNKKEYKQWASGLDQNNIILPKQKIDLVKKMCRKAHGKNSIKHHLQSGWPERTLLWFEPDFGIWCKAKVDWIRGDGKALIDLKKSQNASEFGFQKSIYRYDYYMQAFHYLRGFKHLAQIPQHERVRWYWLVAEAELPCECNIFRADQAAIDEAGDTVTGYYFDYAKCIATGEWPGYADQEIELGYEFDIINDDLLF